MIGVYVNKQLTLSLIIPAYNEEHYIRMCLDAVARQTRMPDEVIVVDNNCTDSTVAIARGYPFVRVVREKRQGRGYARSTGFDAARSDIIGRIDVDSVLAEDWSERVLHHFMHSNDDGIAGVGVTDLLPRVSWPKGILWTWLYLMWTVVFNGFDVMWGANMAIRRTAWRSVRADVCNDDSRVHEDQDISLCMLARGMRIGRDSRLRIATKAQTFNYFPKLSHYTWLRFNTLRRKRRDGSYARIRKTYRMWWRLPLIAISPVFFVPFFVVSLLFWPIDAVIARVDRRFFRHTTR